MILNEKILRTKDSIYVESGTTVMHRWESPIMKKMASFICQDGGDILELGFGMGISASYIQKHNINSHHIIEIHPDMGEDLKNWAKGKKNVDFILGDWFLNKDKLRKYDGILFDTHLDKNALKFRELVPYICKKGCKITWWNNTPSEYNEHRLPNVKFKVLNVNPPKNDYFNHNTFYMPTYIHND